MTLEILNMVFFTTVFLFFFSIPIILFWLSATPKTYTNIGILIAVSVVGIAVAVGCLNNINNPFSDDEHILW